MIRTGFGQVYLNGVESWLQNEIDGAGNFTSSDDTGNGIDPLDEPGDDVFADSLKELEGLKQAYRELAASLQDGIDELVSIARGLDSQLSFLREANTNGPRPAPVPTKDAHVIEEMLRLGRETTALLKE